MRRGVQVIDGRGADRRANLNKGINQIMNLINIDAIN